MIYINVYYKLSEEGEIKYVVEPINVVIEYSKEGNFKLKEYIEPRNGHLEVNKGVYGPKGFFPNILEIKGVSRTNGHVTISLPMHSCIITEHYPS